MKRDEAARQPGASKSAGPPEAAPTVAIDLAAVQHVDPLDRFYAITTTIMGGIVGALVGLPFAGSSDPSAATDYPEISVVHTLLLIILTLCGLFVGYRRRHSRTFFYLCLLSILILASVISSSTLPDLRQL